jgi:cytidylate kinase
MSDRPAAEPLDLDPLHVAIDGPAGSGKSTIAAALAHRLGLVHVETGAMYRALTLLALRESIAPEDGPTLGRRLEAASLRFAGDRLLLDGVDESAAIRAPEVTALVSQVSAHAPVRRAMVRRQREMSWGAREGVVMEGRDIGTVVLPSARCKIYLDADPATRARRRALQMGAATDAATLDRVRQEIEARDTLDSTREESPLQVPPDAHVVDTTDLDIEGVIETCADRIHGARWSFPTAAEMAPFRYQQGHYKAAQLLLRALFQGVFGLRVFGRAHQQAASGVIFASNHVSWFDPPIVGSAVDREVHFLAKRELFVGPFGWLIGAFNAVPILRGRFDPKAFARAQEVLERGHNLMIFPEGTRRRPGQPGPVKKGLGLLALTTGKPYLPCFVRGSARLGRALLRREPLEVWIAPPVILRAVPHLRRSLEEREIQERVGALFLRQIQALAHRSERFHAQDGTAA